MLELAGLMDSVQMGGHLAQRVGGAVGGQYARTEAGEQVDERLGENVQIDHAGHANLPSVARRPAASFGIGARVGDSGARGGGAHTAQHGAQLTDPRDVSRVGGGIGGDEIAPDQAHDRPE